MIFRLVFSEKELFSQWGMEFFMVQGDEWICTLEYLWDVDEARKENRDFWLRLEIGSKGCHAVYAKKKKVSCVKGSVILV